MSVGFFLECFSIYIIRILEFSLAMQVCTCGKLHWSSSMRRIP